MVGHILNKYFSLKDNYIVDCIEENKIFDKNFILKKDMAFSDSDYIINCIGILSSKINTNDSNSVSIAIRINALFPHELSFISKKLYSRVIHISTDGVFGKNSGLCKEDSSCDAHDLYGKTNSLCLGCFISIRKASPSNGTLIWLPIFFLGIKFPKK